MKRIIALVVVIALYAIFVVSFTFANNRGSIEKGFNNLGITGESTGSIENFKIDAIDPMPPPPPPGQIDAIDPMPPPPPPPG